jgi:hypothetical protein
MRKDKEAHRAYQLKWYHENKVLSGKHSNQNTEKTHCIHGHEFTEENTKIKTQDGKEHRTCLTCHREDSRRRAEIIRRGLDKENPERTVRYRQRVRKARLKQIGWTPERFESTLVKQEGKCAICGKVLNREKDHNQAVAHADHAHTVPPKPRGILCGNCNLGIGNLQENVDIMKAAIAYVEKWRHSGT